MEKLKDALDFGDFSRAEQIGLIIFSVFLLLFPWLGAGSFVKAVMIQFLLFSLFGMGWNTIGGYGGQVELGKAQYVGIGAYTVALPWSGGISLTGFLCPLVSSLPSDIHSL
jgi:branched-chain amino acid transport system permease protein